MLEKILHYQIKYSKVLLFFLLIFIGFSAYLATDLKIDPDLAALVSKDSLFNTNDRIINNAYGSNDALLVLVSADKKSLISNRVSDMSSNEVEVYVNTLKETFSQSSYFVSSTPNQISSDKELLRFALVLQSPNEIGSFQKVLDDLNYLIEESGHPPGVKVQITGMPVMMNNIAGYLIGDSLNTILITIIFIVLILYLYSRDLVYSSIIISVPVVSLILLGASMAVLGINVTITLAAVGVLVLGLGTGYSIHIATHYAKAKEEEKVGDAPGKALIQTVLDLWLPITASFLTTFAGFVALMFGVSPSSHAQGMVLSISIAIIYATTLVLFPVLISVFSNSINIKTNVVFEKVLNSLGKFAAIQTKYPKQILSVLGVLTLFMIFAASNVEFSNSNSNWIPSDDSVSKSFSEINFKFGQSESITLILVADSGDLRNAQVKRDVDKMVATIEALPYVDRVSNPYGNLEMDSNSIYDAVTNSNLKSQFNKDFTMTRVVVYNQNIIQDANGKSTLLAEIKEIAKTYPIYNAQTSFYGDAVRFDELTDSLQKDTVITTLVSFSLVFLVASMIYASFGIGVLALVPILVAVIWTVGFMALFGVPFTTLSTGIISLVLGFGVDFSIHLVDSIKKYLKKGKSIQTSIEKTFSSSGKAIILASITTIIGFSALLLAKLLGTQRMGMSLSLSILSVFIVSFTMVPAVMTLLHRREERKSKLKK